MPWPTLLTLGLVLAAGAFVQASIGFGMSVVAAPFVVLLAPELMPGSLLVTSFALPLVQLGHGARDIAWRPLNWALGARALLTPLGVAVVVWWSPHAIGALVGVLILVTVVASVSGLKMRATPRAALAAGALSGISGTAASIGGPFFALVLQHERPNRVRDTMAVFFLAGSLLAVIGLLVAGQFTTNQLTAGLVWLPFLAAGYAAAAPARERLDQRRLRNLVLGFCVVASVSVILRAVFA